jgi:hypothetical protein
MSDLPFKVDVYLWTSTKKKKKVIIMIERYNTESNNTWQRCMSSMVSTTHPHAALAAAIHVGSISPVQSNTK